jgi:hypothetical protein
MHSRGYFGLSWSEMVRIGLNWSDLVYSHREECIDYFKRLYWSQLVRKGLRICLNWSVLVYNRIFWYIIVYFGILSYILVY